MSFDTAIVRFHYEGRFSGVDEELQYVGGYVDDLVFDPDKISKNEFEQLCQRAGYKNIVRMFYQRPGFLLCDGLKPIINDASIIDMTGELFLNDGVIDVYVEHGVEVVPEIAGLLENGENLADPPVVNLGDPVEDVGVNLQGVHVEDNGDINDDVGEVEVDEVNLEGLHDEDVEEDGENGEDEGPTAGENGENDLESDGEGISEFHIDSEYDDSDDPLEIESDEELIVNEATTRRGRFPRFDSTADVPYICKSMLFKNSDEFKLAVSLLAIKEHKPIIWKKNTKKWVRGICGNENCPWMIYGAINNAIDTFQVRKFDNHHDCQNVYQGHPRLSTKILTQLLMKKLMALPFMNYDEIKPLVLADLGHEVSLSMVKRAKRLIVESYVVNYEEEFAKLWSYKDMILLSNPGSTVKMDTFRADPDGPPVFERMYICLGALKEGFLHGCRKFLGIDGCFLKTLTKGQLLCAVGRDGNNQMFLVAWALVEDETTLTWSWFIECLQEDLGIGDGFGFTFMSDQHKAIQRSIEDNVPQAEHRFCARQVWVNWQGRGHRGDEMNDFFWRLVKTPTLREYYEILDKLKQNSSQTATDFEAYAPPAKFCRAFFRLESMVEVADNNLCEAFNKTLLKARKMPVISLFEMMRREMMKRIVKKNNELSRWRDGLGPRIWQSIEKSAKIAQYCHVIFNGADGYEVEHGESRYVVRLEEKTCTCRRYTLSGVPCAHAICAIRERRGNVAEFVSSWYSNEVYMQSYSNPIQSMLGLKDWPTTDLPPVKPPHFDKKGPGRPKGARKKSKNEPAKPTQPNQQNSTSMSRKGMVMTCGLCRKKGHNIRSCPLRATEQTQPPPPSNLSGVSDMEQPTAQNSTTPSHEEVNCSSPPQNPAKTKKKAHSSSQASVSVQIPDLNANANSQAASSGCGDAEASASVILPSQQSGTDPTTVNSSSKAKSGQSKKKKANPDAGPRKKTRFSVTDNNGRVLNVSGERSSPASQAKYANQRPITATSLQRAAQKKFIARLEALKKSEGLQPAASGDNVPL